MANEKRQIDANALSESVSGIGKDIKRPRAVELACLCLIAEAPTVEAVEVVRCKDCKHMEKTTYGLRWCNVWEAINGMGDDGFCNYGERRTDD
jgi:hypothetical protein